MARNKKLINNAENHMIVGSLEVIGDISGSGMKEIKRTVTTLQESVSAYVGETKDYWKELSDDGIITPFEKTILKKEYDSIASSYAAIMHEAVAQQVTDTSAIIAYQAAYNSLRYYINTVLGLFDEMGTNTEIPDRDVFNNYYSTYYSTENFVQVALAVGQIGSLDFTVVDNLNFEGTDDQVVIYKGEIYQWVHDHWKKVGTDGYCGCISYLPSGVAGNFFLAASDFVANIYLLNVDGKTLVSPEGDIICTNQSFDRAYIYEYVNGTWTKVTDTNDYRYIVAMSDYYNLTGELPAIWQDTIDDLQEEIENIHIPKYLGMINVTSNIPASTGSGDWFLWTGSQTTTGGVTYKNLYIYRDTKSESSSAWQELNPADTTYSSYYMSCLNDVLNQTAVIGSETFDVIFANAFFANSASINALKTKTIELTGDEGLIRSENYTAGSTTQKGFILKADGTLDCINGTFRGDVNALNMTLTKTFTVGNVFSANNLTNIVTMGSFSIMEKELTHHKDFTSTDTILKYFRSLITGSEVMLNDLAEAILENLSLEYNEYTITLKKSDDTEIENITELYFPYDEEEYPDNYGFCKIVLEGNTIYSSTNYTMGTPPGRPPATIYDLGTTVKIEITFKNIKPVIVSNTTLPDEDPEQPGVLYTENGILKISL